MEYKWHKNEYGELIECEACRCDVPTELFDKGTPYNEENGTEKRYLCEFCASSNISYLTRDNSRRYHDITQTGILIAQAVNFLKYNK